MGSGQRSAGDRESDGIASHHWGGSSWSRQASSCQSHVDGGLKDGRDQLYEEQQEENSRR